MWGSWKYAHLRCLEMLLYGFQVSLSFVTHACGLLQMKDAEVAEEVPGVEEPSMLPGWGTWAGQQREPKWMRDARIKAQK